MPVETSTPHPIGPARLGGGPTQGERSSDVKDPVSDTSVMCKKQRKFQIIAYLKVKLTILCKNLEKYVFIVIPKTKNFTV